jgi:hypothetical protein
LFIYCRINPQSSDFFGDEFWPFFENYFQKKNILLQIHYFFENFAKNNHDCAQYENMLKIFYFHILNIAKLIA